MLIRQKNTMYLCSLKLDELDIDKLKNVPDELYKLSNVVDNDVVKNCA